MFGRQRDQPAFVTTLNMLSQLINGDFALRVFVTVRLCDHAQQQRQHAVGEHRYRESEQCGPRMAQVFDLAVQHGLQMLEPALNAPAFAVQRGKRGRIDRSWQIGPPLNDTFTRLGGHVQCDLDAPPCQQFVPISSGVARTWMACLRTQSVLMRETSLQWPASIR